MADTGYKNGAEAPRMRRLEDAHRPHCKDQRGCQPSVTEVEPIQ